MLYFADVSGVSFEDAVRLYWSHLGAGEEQDRFANELVRGVGASLESIDDAIRGVSHHWRLERMARVDRNILRLATFELMSLPDVPQRVTLNEAVELAKRFGSDGSAGFVNGVLDGIAQNFKKRS